VTLVIAVGGGAFAVWLRSRRGRQRRARSTTVALSIGAALALIAGTALSSDLGRTATPFFPKPVPRANDRLSPFEIRWASKHLYSMGEPSLTALASRDREATVCRLLWLPSFHHPVSVRIERNRRGAMLRVVVLDGAGGYEPGRIAIDRQLPLRDDQWLALQTRLDRVSFWTMPARINDGGVDGDRVTVECVNAGKYHVVNRYEPAPAFEEMCRFILDLTSLEYRKTWDEYHPGAAEPEVAEPAP